MTYTKQWFKSNEEWTQSSIEEIIPLILKLVKVDKVIDVGCGTGGWLSSFRNHGVEDIWGVDGSWVDRDQIKFPEDRFILHDLTKPLKIDGQFDLVLSLEVAEHLPEECAEQFINSLTSLGPIVLFAAAIPFQGGVHHVNEQWPDYWAEKFGERGYVAIDFIRKKIWNNSQVQFWYAQNMLMFVARKALKRYPLLEAEYEKKTVPLSMVHPEMYLRKVNLVHMPLRRVLKSLPTMVMRTLRRRLKRIFS